MNFTSELMTTADPALSVLTPLQWRLVHVIYEWMIVGATLADCRQNFIDLINDPVSIAFAKPAIKSELQDLNTKLQDATIKNALANLRATYTQKRAEFRAIQEARRI